MGGGQTWKVERGGGSDLEEGGGSPGKTECHALHANYAMQQGTCSPPTDRSRCSHCYQLLNPWVQRVGPPRPAEWVGSPAASTSPAPVPAESIKRQSANSISEHKTRRAQAYQTRDRTEIVYTRSEEQAFLTVCTPEIAFLTVSVFYLFLP